MADNEATAARALAYGFRAAISLALDLTPIHLPVLIRRIKENCHDENNPRPTPQESTGTLVISPVRTPACACHHAGTGSDPTTTYSARGGAHHENRWEWCDRKCSVYGGS